MIGALGLLIGSAWFFVKPLIEDMAVAKPNDFPGPGSGSVEVEVENGDSGRAIGATLTDAGIVKTVEAFAAAYESNPDARSIQPGTYALPEQMRAVDAVTALLDPSYRVDLRITIPEGWTVEQVFERIASHLEVPEDKVEKAGTAAAQLLPPEADSNLEGWLAASTYTIPPSGDAEDILIEMVEKTEEALDHLDVPEDRRQEVITKASIVEKEVPEKYRRQVARVIENRLDSCSGDGTLGMDTTLVYAFGKQYSQIPENELEESPFNTRIHPGLPPNPIGSPSQNAIGAVLDPAEGNWCYFVTINLETQETLFTDDINEHDENQQTYRKYLEKIRSETNGEE